MKMSFRKMLSVIGFMTLAFASVAAANEGAAPAASGSLAPIGAALAIGVAVLGGALGQGKAATAALEGIARNPAASTKIFTPMIIALALIESLVLLAFLIAFIKI